jgi:putative PIN family toxin of toxin-antitoxin system
MRLVVDTNIAVSGLLWNGPPNELLKLAITGRVLLYTSETLIQELSRVLKYKQFKVKLHQHGLEPEQVVGLYARLAISVTPVVLPPVVLADPDDDAVLACAVAAKAQALVSGDSHLLALGTFDGIPILKVTDALAFIAKP